ncbi:MAG: sulfite exporter TauE/SafE family protein [Methanomicrobiaceae archaeon]|nr:sulfite exporter TauE/SafE family protein [Methanomicrobiaceae archaeon]
MTLIIICILLVTGTAVGFMSGLLGVGGSGLMVPVQYRVLHSLLQLDPTVAMRVAFATSLAVVFPTAVSGAAAHYRRHAVAWDAVVVLGVAGCAGGLAGGWIGTHAESSLLGPMLALLLLAASLRMAFPLPAARPERRIRSPWVFVVTGAGIGVLSGMLGIGGGILLVPALILICGFPPHRAVGTSTGFMVLASLGGLAVYLLASPPVSALPFPAVGYVDLVQWLALVGTTIPMAQVGAWASHRTDPVLLRRIFAGMLALAGLDMAFAS